MRHSDRFSPVTWERWPQRIDPVLDRLAAAFAARPDAEVVELLATIAVGLDYAECRALGTVPPAKRCLLPRVRNGELAVVLRGSGDPKEPVPPGEIIELLGPAWRQSPDYRLGQLVVRLTDSIPAVAGRPGALLAQKSVEDDMWDPLFTLLDDDPSLGPVDVGGKWLAAQDAASLESDYGWTGIGK